MQTHRKGHDLQATQKKDLSCRQPEKGRAMQATYKKTCHVGRIKKDAAFRQHK